MPCGAFSIDCPLTGVSLFCWDLRIGVHVRFWEVSVYGSCRYRVFLKKCPGPQTGVNLQEVSASGVSTVLYIGETLKTSALCEAS